MIARARRPAGRPTAMLVLSAGFALGAAGPAATAAAVVEAGASARYLVERETAGPVHVLRTLEPVCSDAVKPEDAALRFLASEHGLLDLPSHLETGLELLKVQESLTGFHVRYAQSVDGIPVWRSSVVVHLDLARCVTKVDRFSVVSGAVASETAVGETDAMDAARNALVTAPVTDKRTTRSSTLRDASEVVLAGIPSVSRVVFPGESGKTGRLAYLVTMSAEVPDGHWEVVVDARSGEVLGLRNLARYVPASGQLYEKVNACIAMRDPTLRDGNDADAAVPVAAYATLSFEINAPVAGAHVLEGAYVRILELPGEAPVIPPPTSPTPSFVFTRNPDGFEAVNTYYHLDLTQRYIQDLGFTNILNGPIRVDVHGFNGADNSHYVDNPAGAGWLAFGDGGVDDAEDADVVYHEYGHAVHHNQVIGWGNNCEGGAMGEGFGDYLAGTMHAQWNYVNECVAMWDATSYDTTPPPLGPCLRRLDTAATWGGNCVEVHLDGEMWSAALWQLHQRVPPIVDAAPFTGRCIPPSVPVPPNTGCQLSNGRDAFNQILFESHFGVPPNGGFREAAIELMAADQRLNGCANCGAICTVMVARGFITNADCPGPGAALQGHTINDAAPGGDGDSVAEPGESILMPVTLRNSGTARLTNVMATLTSNQPTFITITQGTASYGAIPVGGTQVSLSDYAWGVAANAPCGTVVLFTLDITSTEWTGSVSFPETLGRLVGGTYTGPPIDIPDNLPAGVQSTINIASPGTVGAFTARVGLTHSWVGDLVIQLQSPMGTTVTLLDRPGVPAATNGCDDNDMDVTFDDTAATTAATLEARCAGEGTPWYVGSGRPVQPLSGFAGQPISGAWRLTVSDHAGFDLGTIDSWSLVFGYQCGAGGGCATSRAFPDVKAVKVLGSPNARLTWTDAAPDPCHASYKVFRSTVPGMQPSPPPGTWPTNPLFTDITALDIDATSSNTSFEWVPGALEFLKVLDVGTDGSDGPSGSF